MNKQKNTAEQGNTKGKKRLETETLMGLSISIGSKLYENGLLREKKNKLEEELKKSNEELKTIITGNWEKLKYLGAKEIINGDNKTLKWEDRTGTYNMTLYPIYSADKYPNQEEVNVLLNFLSKEEIYKPNIPLIVKSLKDNPKAMEFFESLKEEGKIKVNMVLRTTYNPTAIKREDKKQDTEPINSMSLPSVKKNEIEEKYTKKKRKE
ncbi:hypothetical protein M1614_03680 [Candidatus Marsarchaeota archaeon]|nr:hypothetical protein [Candidatus Marsarchaeota archaeon]